MLLWQGDRLLLQHRALWGHHGGTWGIPGGARNPAETPEQAALREAGEEAGVSPAAVTTLAGHVDDHGGWSYTTVIARATGPLDVGPLSPETIEVRWVGVDELRQLPLHPGFAASWDAVRALSAAVWPGRP